jgi:hypothetical protein
MKQCYVIFASFDNESHAIAVVEITGDQLSDEVRAKCTAVVQEDSESMRDVSLEALLGKGVFEIGMGINYTAKLLTLF